MHILLNDTPEKKDFRENKLPKVPLTVTILVPEIMEKLSSTLVLALKSEIEIYKAFPKNNSKPDLSKFNPRNHKTCFMGLGFGQDNSGWNDVDLKYYRKAIGTINHSVWGNCTLLEIWGADHYDKFPDMVKGVFAYCYNMRKTLPKIKFVSNPFIITKDTGTRLIDTEDERKHLELYFEEYNQIRVSYGLSPLKYLDELPPEAMENFKQQLKNRQKGVENEDIN